MKFNYNKTNKQTEKLIISDYKSARQKTIQNLSLSI